MTFFQNLWRDLVEKRLWPVAALLVAALIAVPFFIGSVAQVSLDETTSSKATNRAGSVRNPFKPEHVVPPAKTGGGAAAAAGAGAAAGTGATASSPKTTPKTSSTGTPPTTPATTTSPSLHIYDWLTRVRIGSHTAMKTHGVRGVTLLPSSKYVLLTYLGVKTDRKTAVFDVSPGTYVSGGGTCLPSPKKCAVLELATGDSALLTRLAGSTGLKRYRVRVLSVKMHTVTDKATTAKAKAARNTRAYDITAGVAG
jgi:hypothetical protein